MNNKLYFVFGFLSAVLLVSMFASVSAFSWDDFKLKIGVNENVESNDDVRESPLPARSPYACTTTVDTFKVRILNACKSVQSPLGQFTQLEASQMSAESLDSQSIITASFSNKGITSTKSLLVRTSSNLQNEGYLFEERPGGGLGLRSVFANGGQGDGVLILDDLVVSEGSDFGSVNVVDLVGTGNAYVCADAHGHLYRSNTACR